MNKILMGYAIFVFVFLSFALVVNAGVPGLSEFGDISGQEKAAINAFATKTDASVANLQKRVLALEMWANMKDQDPRVQIQQLQAQVKELQAIVAPLQAENEQLKKEKTILLQTLKVYQTAPKEK